MTRMTSEGRRALFSVHTAIQVAYIMRRAGLINATPFWTGHGCVIEATYWDAQGYSRYVAPGNFRGVRKVIERYKRERSGGDGG